MISWDQYMKINKIQKQTRNLSLFESIGGAAGATFWPNIHIDTGGSKPMSYWAVQRQSDMECLKGYLQELSTVMHFDPNNSFKLEYLNWIVKRYNRRTDLIRGDEFLIDKVSSFGFEEYNDFEDETVLEYILKWDEERKALKPKTYKYNEVLPDRVFKAMAFFNAFGFGMMFFFYMIR